MESTWIVGIRKGYCSRRDGVERARPGDLRSKSIAMTIRHDHVRKMPHVHGFSETAIGPGGTPLIRRRRLRDHGASAKPAFEQFKVGALAARALHYEAMRFEFAGSKRFFDDVRDPDR